MTRRRRPRAARTSRYLPRALLTTGLVVLAPPAIVHAIVPRGGLLPIAVSALAAVVLSVAIAGAGAALWKRQPGARDFVFADLLLWNWVHRRWTDRRLSQARTLFDSARKSGPHVSIELITGLSRLLEARDPYTHRHGQRVAREATRIAHAMHLSPVEVAKIQTAATVHDVGKLYTPREILENPSRLSDAEYEVAKRHAAWGARMLASVGDEEIASMVRHHHERIDGTGYPDRLAGSDIPLGARIIAVADTFDAITSSRAYRRACTHKHALDVLAKEAGTQLDPAVVAAFQSRYAGRRSIAGLALTATAPARILDAVQAASQAGAALLPGVGAAALLALSPALPGSPFARANRHGVRAGTGISRAAAPAAPAAARRSVEQLGASLRPGSHHRVAPTLSRPAPVRTSSGGISPSPTAAPRRSSAGAPPPSGAGPSPPADPQLPTPPVTGPPAPPVPPVTPPVTLPTVTPPVTLPNVPEVHVPPVQVPELPSTGAVPGA